LTPNAADQASHAERLIRQQQASPNTVAAYRDTFRLLLTFAEQQRLPAT
jgi:integrase/recombinase XerD